MIPTVKQLDSPWAAEFNARLADGSIPLPTAVAWWHEKWRTATLDISPFDLGDAEFAAYGIGFYDRAINESHGVPGAAAAYEIDKQRCWADLERARSEALRRNRN
jgi:hypothetical protein